MNALSGKFGQKVVATKTVVCKKLPEDPQFSFMADLSNIVIEPVDGLHLNRPVEIGYFVTGEKQEAEVRPSLPIYLSMKILAHSRRHMSKVGGHSLISYLVNT